MMNPKLRRLIETTIPMVIGYGLAVSSITALMGFRWGFVGIIVFAIVDVLMIRTQEMHPTHIKYDGRYFSSLTELIRYVKRGG